MFTIPDFENIRLTRQLYLKPDYLNHEFISGNKMRKLKYHSEVIQDQAFKCVLTFGGAYSNHIAAVATLGNLLGIDTIGLIRGDELSDTTELNPTLKYAKSCGMFLHFVTRAQYKHKTDANYLKMLRDTFGDFYMIPEGGTSPLAIKGCEELLTAKDQSFDYICCAVGTGGTIAGIINSARPHQKVLGFPALKGEFLDNEISKLTSKRHWNLVHDYHFGGYAKINEALISFINGFRKKYEIPLDPIYTGKMLFGIFDLIEKGYFSKDDKILAIHTGGLQGISGMNAYLQKKKLPLIEVS